MTDSNIQISAPSGELKIEYSIHPKTVTVRFEYQGARPSENYAMLFQNANVIGTRNGTPIYFDLQTEEGEALYHTTIDKIKAVLFEHYSGGIDTEMANVLREGAGIDLQSPREIAWRDRQARRRGILECIDAKERAA